MFRTQRSDVLCTVQGCSKKFVGNNEMTRHVKEYHGEIKQCPHCPYKSKRLRRIQNHMDKKHQHKVVLEVQDDSFSHDCSPTIGKIASQPQNGGVQQTAIDYGYSEPSLEFQSPHYQDNVSIHSPESRLSSRSNEFDVPAAVGSALQMNPAGFGMSYNFHPPMALPSAVDNNAATHMSAFWNPDTSDNGWALGPNTVSREQALGKEGNDNTHGNPGEI